MNSEVRSQPTPNPTHPQPLRGGEQEGKSEVVFVKDIRATLQKHFAFKGGVRQFFLIIS